MPAAKRYLTNNFYSMIFRLTLLVPFFCLLVTSALSQNIRYNIGAKDDRIQDWFKPTDHVVLPSGDVLIKTGEAMLDIFKQNVYPSELYSISSTNEVKFVRNIKDTVIFKLQLFNDAPYMFFSDISGLLKCVKIDETNLGYAEDFITLIDLYPFKKSPSKINDITFPQIVFSADNSKFAVLYPRTIDKVLTFKAHVFDSNFNKIYDQDIQTTHRHAYSLELQSVLLKDNGNLYFTATNEKIEYEVYGANQKGTHHYKSEAPENRLRTKYSDVLLTTGGEPFFYSLVTDNSNHFKLLEQTLLSENLEKNSTSIQQPDLMYPPGAVKSAMTLTSLLFNRLERLPNGEFLLVAEYGIQQPQPTTLGYMLIQKINTGYTYSGPIVALHLNADMSIKSSKLIPKSLRMGNFIKGHHFKLRDQEAHFIFHDNKPKASNLVDVVWNLEDDSTVRNTIVAYKEVSKKRTPLEVQEGINPGKNSILLLGWFKERILLNLD